MPVTVNLNPQEPVTDPTSGSSGDDVAARRKALHALHDAQDKQSSSDPFGSKLDLEKATEEPFIPREQIDSIVLETPIGEIVFGPPPGVSLTMRIAMMMGERNGNITQNSVLRMLMCVRSINGEKVTAITNMTEATYLANVLGDGIMDALFAEMQENWPPPTKNDLQVVRKNKRVS